MLPSEASNIVTFSCKCAHLGCVNFPRINILEDFSKKNLPYDKIMRFNCVNRNNLLDL